MRGAGPAEPRSCDTEQWIFPKIILTSQKKRSIIATIAEIMTEAMFHMHVYIFVGKMFKQAGGGTIGLCSTYSVSRIVWNIWDDKWLERLDKLTIRLEVATSYMDDRHVTLYPYHASMDGDGQVTVCSFAEGGG